MTDLLVTADTNLLVSGIERLRGRPEAATARFIRAWMADRFTLVLSDHLLAEIERTWDKRYFAERLRGDDRVAFRQLIRRRAVITPITVAVSGVATHPEDDLVLATALSGNASFVVTGDYKLLGLKVYEGLALVSVHAFLDILPGLERDASE